MPGGASRADAGSGGEAQRDGAPDQRAVAPTEPAGHTSGRRPRPADATSAGQGRPDQAGRRPGRSAAASAGQSWREDVGRCLNYWGELSQPDNL